MLDDIKLQLAARGVSLSHTEEDFEPDRYDVSVNGIAYRIYGPEVQDPVEYWRVSTERTLALINDLLARAGSDERVYHLGGAEDGAAVFLTLTMVDVIHSSESLRDSWLPEQP